MDRRRFLQGAFKSAIAALGIPFLAHRLPASDDLHESLKDNSEGLPTFAYYQGLGPNERRSPQRTDGTDYNMPRISQEDLEAGETKFYEFWHGHSGRNHSFTITAEQFSELKNGKTLEVYTDVVDSHRHAVRIN